MSATAVLDPTSTVAVPPNSVPSPQSSALPKMTVQEYFEFERTQEIRYEYVEGELIAMPGTSLEHNQIVHNFVHFFERAFEENECRVFSESIRLRISSEKYRYPDVMALCEEPVTDGEKPPALLNPSMAVEVLSASTEETDKWDKLFEYQTVASLTDYLLVAQDRVHVVHCVKQSASQWLLTTYTKPTDTLTFPFLNVSMTLADIYRKISFDAPQNSV
jgi:Uma2 family endonuclease